MEAHAASASIEKISLREGSGGSRRRGNVPAGFRLLRSKTDVKRKAQHEERKSLGTKFCIGILEKGKLEKKKKALSNTITGLRSWQIGSIVKQSIGEERGMPQEARSRVSS